MADGDDAGTTAPEGDAQGDAGTTGGDDKKFSQADLDRIVADRVGREKAKYADYGDLKKKAAAAMTDQEKLVADAEARGKAAGLSASGTRLAKAELKAAAAGRVDADTLAGFVEYADLSKFLGEDGEPDEKAIDAAITKLGGAKRTNFDGGARGRAATGNDMNQIIRRAAGRG